MTNIILREDSRPNFCNKEGKAYLVRCVECKRENYLPAVASGVCAWCEWDLNENKIINFSGKPISTNED